MKKGLNSIHSVTLKDYVDEKFRVIEAQTKEARETMDKRLEGMNEFRTALSDQAGRFVTRTELDLILDRINKDKTAFYSMLLSALALVGLIVNILLK